MIRWIGTVVGLAVAVSLPRAALAQLDKVIPPRGATIEGTITAMSPDKVTLDAGGTTREFNVNEISRLSYGEEPSELTRAREALITGGQIERAQTMLNAINAATLARDVVKQDLEYYKAYCESRLALAGNGNPANADKAMLAFVSAHRGSYHVYEATELLGELALSQGNFDDAAKRFAFLGKAPWPDYKLRANVMEARALTAQKKFGEAIEKYDGIMASGENTPEANRQKLMASVGKSACLAETGKPDEGIQALEKIVRDNDSSDKVLFGKTYNALGICYLRANRPKDALLAFLHVDLLFNKDGEAHAEALYHLGKLWGDLNKADRALAARSLLKERYGGSIWNKQPTQ